MNDTAKKLREAADYMKGEGVTSLGAIIRLHEMFDVADPGTAPANLGAILEAIADELDELQARATEANNLRQQLESAEGKAERRKKHIGYLNTALHDKNGLLECRGGTIARLTAENGKLRKQVPTEREREILDMWPRFEDSEYVWFGDEVACRGKACMLDDVKFVSDGTFHDETYLYVSNGLDVFEVPIAAGERVKRPDRSVPDADGVEIRVGDTVWHEDGSEWLVEEITRFGARCFDGDRRRTFIPAFLTHTPPDSWERLEEDAEKLACAYLGRSEGTCFGCPLENCKDFAACSKEQAKDIVRRAKALAGVEVD